MIGTFVQIAIGGAAGATSRYLVTLGVSTIMGNKFPYGTLFVNIIGSLLMGFIIALMIENLTLSDRYTPFVITGFLGGFTTFSAFSYDFWQLSSTGKIEHAILYALVSFVLAIGALYLGMFLARVWFH